VGGHTNQTFFVGDSLVLRRSWRDKPAAQIAREERLLTSLAPALPVPRIVPTLDGALHVDDQGHALHLFCRLPGTSAAVTAPVTVAAMAGLASLHHALAPLDGNGDAVSWLRERLANVRGAGADNLPAQIAAELPRVLDEIARLLDGIVADSHWLHGDFHLGNLLFDDTRLTGILDFDDCGWGAPSLEAAFALFAITRRASDDNAFSWDEDLWQLGAAAYRTAGGVAPFTDGARLFCADQVLIHLGAAQRGLWRLGPRIGFLACWRALLSQ
jgi:Ser/Thr protein kinase RdoA (MazF antagonist)